MQGLFLCLAKKIVHEKLLIGSDHVVPQLFVEINMRVYFDVVAAYRKLIKPLPFLL